MKKFIEVALALSILLLTVSVSSAQGQTAYTSDPNIADFTAGITSYATLSNFNNSDGCTTAPFTPTSLELMATPCRVYNLAPTPLSNLPPGNNWILAAFSSPVSRIVVFPNIDHYGSAYDGYQYQIYGSNDYGSDVPAPTWTQLFDATSVKACVSGCVDGGTGEPFTLGTSTGTPPSTVNNVETGGCNPGPVNSPGSNCVGYEAQFTFGTAYKYYAFGASTVAAVTSNTEQELSAVGASSQTVNLQFTSTSTTQIATVGNPTDPAAQSLALTLASVTPGTIVNVSVEFFYEPTEFSTGAPGIGVADGECEPTATDLTDFDCRLTPTFVYPANLTPPQTLSDGGQLVPHIIPSHNLLGVWVRVIATLPNGSPAVEGIDYKGPVLWYYAINTNPSLASAPVNSEYSAGWNNMNLQMYDRPGTIIDINGHVVTNPNIDFVNNITTFFKNCDPNCVGNPDPGVGGKTPTLNDIVVAAPPNPPAGAAAFGTVELLVPVPGISPFPYFKGLPMLVAFELENESKETSITNALTLPHSVNVATFGPSTLSDPGKNIPVQIPQGFPATFTYNRFTKAYYIFLSPAPYVADGKTKYTMQINSDLFPQPVTATFVVKKNLF